MSELVWMLRDDWEPINLEYFSAALSGKRSVKLRIPLPSIHRTNSYLDFADELLEASYFCETLAKSHTCGPLTREADKSESEGYSEFFVLVVTEFDARVLANELHVLQWVFNGVNDTNLAEAAIIRSEVWDHVKVMEESILRFPELAEDYLSNKVGACYQQYGLDSYAEELERFPERRLGFWQSPRFAGLAETVLVSVTCWVYPAKLTKERVFSAFGYDTTLSLLNADLVLINGSAVLFSEGISLGVLASDIHLAFGAISFLGDEEAWFENIASPTTQKVFVSEFKEFFLIESGQAHIVIFLPTFQLPDGPEAIEALKSAQVKYESGIFPSKNPAMDLSGMDDELFEQLCYDIIYADPSFDNTTIRKMGRSRSRDGGRDITVYTKPRTIEKRQLFIFQCKAIASHKSLNTSNLGSMSDVIDQYGAAGYGVMTSGYIDATVYDRLDQIAATRKLETKTWSRFEIERFVSRRPQIAKKYGLF